MAAITDTSGSWGLDLWDQWNLIENYTKEGMDTLNSMTDFMKKRAAVEAEYAKGLQKLSASFRDDMKKKNSQSLPREKTTLARAWSQLVNETDDIAKHHEGIAEQLGSTLTNNLRTILKDYEKERKAFIAEAERQRQELAKAYHLLDQAQKSYQKSCKEVDVAKQQLDKIEESDRKDNYNKAKEQLQNKKQKALEAEETYSSVLQEANFKQADHFEKDMRTILNDWQNKDEFRINRTKDVLVEYFQIQKPGLVFLGTCLDNIAAVSGAIDGNQDCRQFALENRTGQQYPQPKLFVVYGSSPPSSLSSSLAHSASVPKKRVTVLKSKRTESEKRAIAISDYTAEAAEELDLKVGDMMHLLTDLHGSNLIHVKKGTLEGLVPRQCVEFV